MTVIAKRNNLSLIMNQELSFKSKDSNSLQVCFMVNRFSVSCHKEGRKEEREVPAGQGEQDVAETEPSQGNTQCRVSQQMLHTDTHFYVNIYLFIIMLIIK